MKGRKGHKRTEQQKLGQLNLCSATSYFYLPYQHHSSHCWMPLLPLPEPPAGACPSSHHVPVVWLKGSGAELFCRGKKRGCLCWDMNVLIKKFCSNYCSTSLR